MIRCNFIGFQKKIVCQTLLILIAFYCLQHIDFQLQQLMLKSIKLNTINLSNCIFTTQNTSTETNNQLSKFTTTVNKSFKYSYARTKNQPNVITKNGSKKDHTRQFPSKTPVTRNIIGTAINHVPKSQRNTHRYSRSSTSHELTHPSIEISHPNHHSSEAESHKQQHTRQINKNKAQNGRQKTDSQCHKESEYQRQKSNPSKQTAKGARNHSVARVEEQFEVSFKQRRGIKSRTAPKGIYTNSIIKSYNIKSIELEHPYDNRTRKASLHHIPAPTPSPTPFIVEDHNNAKLVFAEEFERIELQRLRFQNPRMNPSTRHCKRRPQTSKLPTRIEQFQPKPWQSQERQDEIFMKESSLLS